MSIKASKEQSIVIDAITRGENVTTEAVAGAGKTTCILLTALANPEKKICIITYSRRLSDQSKVKIEEWGVLNVQIFTYHGFCTKYFGPSHNDSTFSQFTNSSPRLPVGNQLKQFDILCIDEMQDMNDLYYKFMYNKLQYFKDNIILKFLSDRRQAIFQYNGGDPKYFVEAEKYWGRKFTKCYLTKTYRVPKKITHCVNTLIASKYDPPFAMEAVEHDSDLPMEYHWVDVFWGGKQIILDQIKEFGINNVVVMSCSVKEKTPVYKCLNELSEKGVKMCVLNDSESNDPEILRDKLMASSIHKQKGSEHGCIIIYGLDCSYHKYYGKNKPLEEYLNLIYVGFTRSMMKLVIIGDKKHGYLKNWQPSEISALITGKYLKVYGRPLNKCDCTLEFKCQCAQKPGKDTNVTDIIQYRSFECLNELINQSAVKIVSHKGKESEISSDNKALMKNKLVENVAHIYGVMIPMIAEYHIHKQIRMIDYIVSDRFEIDFEDTSLIKHLDKDRRYTIATIYNKIKSTTTAKKSNQSDIDYLIDNLEDFGYLTLCILCYDSYVYPLYQIDNYDWIETQYVIDCTNRLLQFNSKMSANQPKQNNLSETKINSQLKMVCTHTEQVDMNWYMYGRVDDIIGDSIIEYKVSKSFSDTSHISQLLIYMWIMKKTTGYLYYPNLDSTIAIAVTNKEVFLNFTENWLNKLSIDNYQMELKTKHVLKPVIQRSLLSSDSDTNSDEDDINHLKKTLKGCCL